MAKPEIPPGYALVRLADLATLLAGPKAPPEPADDAWTGVSVAVAMLTARLGGHDLEPGQLADGVRSERIIGALLAMASVGLRHCLAGQTEQFLQDMGALAVARGRGPDGRPL